ncbi:MAG: hypothetical protein K8S62_04325 [Candidatus Sabulitectum sp.]|nr:hypothetical protein [Candidatus Sabulitectum sp.]
MTERFLSLTNMDRGIALKKALQLVSVIMLLILPCCKSITELDSAFKGEVVVLSSDLTVAGVISIPDGPGSILVYPGHILVATIEGIILDYDSESLEKLGEYQVGPPSPSGYSEMIHSSAKGAVYLLGSYGNILELDLPECTVTDMFSVCQMPTHMVSGGPDSPYIFVSDGVTNEVIRIKTSMNLPSGSLMFNQSIRTMAPLDEDTMIVATGGKTEIMYELAAAYLFSTPMYSEEAQGIGTIWNREYTVAVFSGNVGTLYSHSNPDSTEYIWSFERVCPVEGSSFLIRCDEMLHANVVSYTGDGKSLLSSYDYTTGNILHQVELNGFPIDLEVSPAGNVFVLTAFE